MHSLRALTVVAFAGSCLASFAAQTDENRWQLDLETGSVSQRYNGVRVPNDGGTKIDFAGLAGSKGRLFGRASLIYTTPNGAQWKATYAPLSLSGDGALSGTTSFGGATFSPAAANGLYRFDTYRFTYRKPWKGRWSVGGTLLIRDAEIRVSQNGTSATESNLGFAPLLNVFGSGAIGQGWGYEVEFDGLAGGPGRAFDISARVTRPIDERTTLFVGYRLIEGGADVPSVWNFAWLDFVTVGAVVRF